MRRTIGSRTSREQARWRVGVLATGALAFVHDQRASLWDIAGAAPVVLEAGGILTAERGTPLFPLDPDGYDGEPIAFLAGDPIAHDESLREVLGAVEAG